MNFLNKVLAFTAIGMFSIAAVTKMSGMDTVQAKNHVEMTPIQVMRSVIVQPITTFTVKSIDIPEEEDMIEEVKEPDFVLSEDTLNLMASLVRAEGDSESEYCKRLIIDTILNRVDDSRFPNTVEGVIMQRGQFSPIGNGGVYRYSPTEEVKNLINEELVNRTDYNVKFFSAGYYIRYGTPYKHVDHTYFCSMN